MRTQIDNLGKVSITCNGKWELTREYDRLCLVHDGFFASYISKKHVPKGINLEDEEYWQPVANLRDDVKLHLSEFEKKVITLIASIQLKLKSARIVVSTDEEREALTVNEVAPGCEVYVLENKQTWILDSIVVGGNYKTWHLEIDSKIDSEEKYELEGQFDNLTADRAICDGYGNIIHDTYITRDTIHNFVDSIISDFLKNFKLDITDGSITYDDLSEQVKQLLGNKNKITNFPDEEDITVVNKQLKFKDREYQEGTFNGMGYKILRKNMMGQINLLEQSMINEPNTIYEIRYDFCLDGKTINIPENCILKFNGGSIRNGKIIFRINSTISGDSKFVNVETSNQSFQYNPKFNTIYYFNLNWFGDNIENTGYPNFNRYYDSFLKFLGNWKDVNHFDIRLYVPSGRYYITKPFYIPNWVSIDFGYSFLEIEETNAIYDDYIIKINIDEDKYKKGEINWVYSYPRKSGYIKNLILRGYYNKGILGLDNREYKDISFYFLNNDDSKEYISLDQYPEGDFYNDNSVINGITSVIGNNQNMSKYAWIKLGTGDAGIFRNITGARLFIYNRQGFVLNGGIQCYPYVVCSIGKFINIHNEFAVDSTIASSNIEFDNCIFYRKNDLDNINIFNIIPGREIKNYNKLPFDVTFKTEVTLYAINYLLFNNCRFLYNYKAYNYTCYDINIDSNDNNAYNNIICNNTFKTFYGYGNQNAIHYKLNIKTLNTKYTNILYNDTYNNDIYIRNSKLFYLEADTRSKTDNEYGNIIKGDNYNYYAAFKLRNNIYRLNNINIIANSNWNIIKLFYQGIPDECYLIREHNREYKIAIFELLHTSHNVYCEDYIIDWGDILSNRIKWIDYSDTEFNKLINIEDITLYNTTYNVLYRKFNYISDYDISINIENINNLNTLFNLSIEDSIICANKEYSIIDSQIVEKNKFKGDSNNRPKYSYIGQQYFDTTLNKPIWWNGTNWIDSTGTTV